MEHDGGQAWLADLARTHGLGQEGLSGIPPEFTPEQMDHPGRSRSGQRDPTFVGIARERLFADDVFSGGDGGQRYHRVGMGRRGDADGVDPLDSEGLIHRGERPRDVERVGPECRLYRVLAR